MQNNEFPTEPSEPPDCNVNFRTIKTSLKSIVKDPDLIPKIEALVKQCNHVVRDVYTFIRLYILHKYHKGEKIPKLTKKFITDCMNILGFKANRGKIAKPSTERKDIADFYLNEFQPISDHKKLDLRKIKNILAYLSVTIKTSIIVNIKEHFIKRLFRFINILAGEYYDDNYNGAVLDVKTYAKTRKSELSKLKNAIVNNTKVSPVFTEWFDEHKSNIIQDNMKKNMAYDCKADPWKYLKPSIYMAQKIEEFNDKICKFEEEQDGEKTSIPIKKFKLFQVLPLCKSNIPKYIPLDTTALLDYFDVKGKTELLKNVTKNKARVWNLFFNMKNKVFKDSKNHTFHYMIQTDGVACSILKSPKNCENIETYCGAEEFQQKEFPYIDKLSTSKLAKLSQKKIVVADPGKLNLVYMMDEQGSKLRYTCKQRDTESLCKKNRRILSKNKEKNGNIIPAETDLSNYLSTTVQYDKFKDFIKAKDIANEKTREFYEEKLYRKLNWRTKTNRQKSEDKFVNNIKKTFGKKEDLVICIGDWSNPKGSGIKGAPTINLGLKRLISKKYKVLLIDEYNTSKKCCNCGDNLENYKIANKKIFRILTCKSCKNKHIGRPKDKNSPMGHSSAFINRDLNSCVNMLKIVKSLINGKGRPDVYKQTRLKNLL